MNHDGDNGDPALHQKGWWVWAEWAPATSYEVLSIVSLHLNALAVFVPHHASAAEPPFYKPSPSTRSCENPELRDTVRRTHFWNSRRSTCFGTRCLVFCHASPSLPNLVGWLCQEPSHIATLHFGSSPYIELSSWGSWLEQRRKCPWVRPFFVDLPFFDFKRPRNYSCTSWDVKKPM